MHLSGYLALPRQAALRNLKIIVSETMEQTEQPPMILSDIRGAVTTSDGCRPGHDLLTDSWSGRFAASFGGVSLSGTAFLSLGRLTTNVFMIVSS